MKALSGRFIFFAILTGGICQSGIFAEAPGTKTITDMAGRKVTLPATIASVYSISPMGEIVMYTLAPSKITGKTWDLDYEEKPLLIDDYLKKPVLGGWFGKSTTGNPEVIIKAHPDVVLSMGDLDKTDISAAERIQEQLGIPVVMIDGKFDALDSTYRFLGRLVGEEARADTLARYCRSTIRDVASAVAGVPEKNRPGVYYAEGLNGLETDPKGSMHTVVLDLAGGHNVADIPAIKGYGRGAVSFEQLLVWKPQIVLVCMDHGYAHGTENFGKIMADPAWAVLDAVKNKNVFVIPALPFNWFDRPPSVNRVMGLRWLTNLLYPDRFKIDIWEDTRRFYELFYHKKLTSAELNDVLRDAIRKQ